LTELVSISMKYFSNVYMRSVIALVHGIWLGGKKASCGRNKR